MIQRTRRLLMIAVIFAVTAFAYYPSLKNTFISLDDGVMVAENGDLANLSLRNIGRLFTSVHYGLYHPLVSLSYAAEVRLFGMDPLMLRIDNLYLHLLNTLLVFVLSSLLTRRRMVPFFVALLFAVHPQHVESVAWVSERKDLLYAAFFLGALILTALALAREKKRFYAAAFLLAVLSLLSKPMAVTLPFALLLLPLLSGTGAVSFRRFLCRLIPFFLLSLLFAAVAVLHYAPGAPHAAVPSLGALARVPFHWAFYIGKLLLPLRLSCVYPQAMAPVLLAPELLVPVGAAVILLAGALRSPLFRATLFGVLFFLVTLLPVSGLTAVGIAPVADRYTYLPSFGIFFALAEGAAFLYERWCRGRTVLRAAAWGAAAACLALLAAGTFRRAALWGDNFALFDDALRAYPQGHAVLYNGRGLAYKQAGNNALAKNDFLAAIRMAPGFVPAYVNLGNIAQQGHDGDLAVAFYRTAIRCDRGHLMPVARQRLGLLYAGRGDYAAAGEQYALLLKEHPSYLPAHFARAELLARMGNAGAALACYRQAAALAPSSAEAHAAIAALLLSRNAPAAALAEYRQALACDPGNAALLNSSGVLYAGNNDLASALRCFSAAIKHDPSMAAAYMNRGNVYALTGNAMPACADFSTAIRLDRTLGEAYFKRAVIWYSTGKAALMRRDLACARENGYRIPADFQAAAGAR